MDEKIMKTKFVDECGENEVTIEPCNPYKLNMGQNTYKIAEGMKPKTKAFKKSNPLTSDIGFKSEGFAQIATLATIVAIAGIVVAYLLLRF